MVEAERLAGSDNGSDADLSWLLDDLVTRVAQIDKALILSRDGLAIGASRGFTREDAEHLSAVAAGFQSLAADTVQSKVGGRTFDYLFTGERCGARDGGREKITNELGKLLLREGLSVAVT